jgi:hypothetical protein
VPSALGPLELHLFIGGPNDKVHMASYADYPAGSVTKDNQRQVIEGARNGVARSIKGKVVSEKKVTLGKSKVEGSDFFVEGEKVNLRVRIFLKGDRLYQVTAAAAGDWAKSDAATKFLDSFAIKD